MNQAVTAGVTDAAAKAPALATALIRGRIEGKARKWKNREGVAQYSTLIRLPNPDEFTTLGVVEVISAELLGEEGDTWHGRVRLSGSVRPFNYTDSDGQKLQGRECTIRLSVA